MMDVLTTKQWFFLSCISYTILVYFGFKYWTLLKEARNDRAVIYKAIVKIGAALNIDVTKGDKS